MGRKLIWPTLLGLVLIQSGCGDGGDSGSVPSSEAGPPASAPERAPPSPSPPPPPPRKDEQPAPPGPETPTDASQADETPPAVEPEELEEQSMENLEWLAEAMDEYHEKHRHFPPAATYDADGRPLLSWRVALLPWLDEEKLYEQFHLDEPWDGPHNKSLIDRMPDVYKTPGGPEPPKTCYLVPVGLGTMFSEREGLRRAAVRDGLSDTLLLVEADPDRAVIWTKPEDLRFIPAQPAAGLGALREGGFLAAAGDAASHKVPPGLEPDVLRALFTCKGREPVSLASLSSKPGQAPPAAQAGGELLARAQEAMAGGRERQGIDFLLADAVVRADDEVLGKVRWSPGLKRPALAVRLGIAVQTVLPTKQPGETREGDTQRATFPGRLPPAVAEHRGDDPGDVPPDAMPSDPVAFWQQKVTEPLVKRLQIRVEDGYFGEWFQQFGETAVEDKEGIRRLPGMVLIGAAESNRFRQVVGEERLDLLLIAHVGPRRSRKLPGQTAYTLRILDVARDATLWTSKPLSNLRLITAARSGSDPATDLIDDALDYVDENLRLQQMPTISREAALRRAGSLAKLRLDNPLPLLMELRYYEWKGLLAPEELSEHYAALLGPDDGHRLATGTEPQRRLVVDRWLPKE